MEEPVIVRLNVEFAKRQIVQALSAKELSVDIERAVDLAVKNFDFVGILQNQIDTVLTSALRSALTAAAYDFVRDPEVHALLKDKFISSLKL